MRPERLGAAETAVSCSESRYPWDDAALQDVRHADLAWMQEIDQIGRMVDDEGDGGFFYSGLAQAVILDWLLPEGKAQALAGGVVVEDLLETAVGSSAED